MIDYATKRFRNRRRIFWASRLPSPASDANRLAAVADAVRSRFFSATIVACLPDGETLAVEASEDGRRIRIAGRRGSVKVSAGVLWSFLDACRKADGGGR